MDNREAENSENEKNISNDWKMKTSLGYGRRNYLIVNRIHNIQTTENYFIPAPRLLLYMLSHKQIQGKLPPLNEKNQNTKKKIKKKKKRVEWFSICVFVGCLCKVCASLRS